MRHTGRRSWSEWRRDHQTRYTLAEPPGCPKHRDHLSFKANNNGAIPPNVGGADALPPLDGVITPKGFAEHLEETTNLLKAFNTLSSDGYRRFCLERGAPVHPARMPSTLVEFFVRFLTDEGDTVLDPFAGSNTTGAVAQNLRRRWLSIEADWTYAAHST